MNFSFCRFRTERARQYQTRSATRISHHRRARESRGFEELSDGHSLPLVGARASALTCLNGDRVRLETAVPCTTRRSRCTAPATDARASSMSRIDQPMRAERHLEPWARRAARHWTQSRRRRRGWTRRSRNDRPAAALACHVRLQSRRRHCRRAHSGGAFPGWTHNSRRWLGPGVRAHRDGGSRSAQKLRIRIAMNAAIPHGW